jgi:outer membrane protein assembly factor BamB
MRPRTFAAVVLVFALLAAGAVLALGGLGGGSDLALEWASDTHHDVSVNHHHPAVLTGDEPLVFAPVSGRANTTDCALLALDAADGDEQWRHQVPADRCAIHAVADPSIGDFDADGTREVFAATTERRVYGFAPASGDVEFAHRLSAYGYSKPLVTDFVGDDRPEVVVVDAKGEVSVVHANGTTEWTRQLDAYTFGQPAVEDFDADGDPELVVGISGNGSVYAFERDGGLAWSRSNATDRGVTWQTTGQLDDDPAVELVTATGGGRVVTYDGRTGATEWKRNFGNLAAVHAVGDGDGDGTREVYATAEDGVLRALDGRNGETEWTTALTTADVQMMPPPSLGDVDGDGERELVATTNGGKVAVVSPADGAVESTYTRDVTVYTHPVLADADGDGADEVYVMYSDGVVVALSAS